MVNTGASDVHVPSVTIYCCPTSEVIFLSLWAVKQLINCEIILKKNQPRMWDGRKYELVVPGHPTRARRVSVGCPGATSEYLWSSHI